MRVLLWLNILKPKRTVSKDQNEFNRDVTDLRQNKGTRALLIISS